MSEMKEFNEPQTVFITNIDSYLGERIGQHFSQHSVGLTIPKPAPTDKTDEITGNESTHSMQAHSVSVHLEATPKYKVIGATRNVDAEKQDWLSSMIKYSSHEELLESMLECDVIICDITNDKDSLQEALWLAKSLLSELENFDSPKTFILVSSVLMWARTKPIDPEDADMPFTEDDFRRRKAHRNFEDHLSVEKEILRIGNVNPTKLSTYVIGSGLVYGAGENMFHFFFKAAWLGESSALQCFGDGGNVLPTIHVHDLASVLRNVCERKPQSKYILAIDESNNTLKDIVEAISINLGAGKMHIIRNEEYAHSDEYMHDAVSSTLSVGAVEYISKEDALLIRDLKQNEFDSLLVDLRMEPQIVRDEMNVDWLCRGGLVANMEKVVAEYRAARGLVPMRVCVLGPPASGKTELSKMICKHYKLHHIDVRSIIKETLDKLEQSMSNIEQGSSVQEDNESESGRQDSNLLQKIQESLEDGGDRLEDKTISKLFRKKLKSTPCLNQGYVLDGYPKTLTQAYHLFAGNEDSADDGCTDPQILPELVVILDGSEKDKDKIKQHLHTRIMNLDESIVQDTHNTEDGFLRRWDDYRNECKEIIDYLRDGKHDRVLEIDILKTSTLSAMMTIVAGCLKQPRNYGVTDEERELIERTAAEKRLERENRERDEKERAEAEEQSIIKQRKDDWMNQLEGKCQQEMLDLEKASVPLRKYMHEHVMPTLTKGLIECVKERPDNPIDFLAEYIFKNNPDV